MKSAGKSNQPTFVSIQYLRFLAAILVVCIHLHLESGQQGVDIFFVISGFIMMYVSEREANPGLFLWARVVRIMPLYWLTTLYFAFRFRLSDFNHLILSMFLIPHAGPMGNFPIVFQGWTLETEALFYVAFAATLYLPRSAQLPALSALLVFLVIVGFAVHPSGAIAERYLNPILLEFVAGGWLYYLWRSKKLTTSISVAMILAAIPMLIITAFCSPNSLRAAVWGIPAFLLVAGSLGLDAKLPRVRWLMLLGGSSYALYLIHPIVIGTHPELTGMLPNSFRVLTLMTACTVAAVLVHVFVEGP